MCRSSSLFSVLRLKLDFESKYQVNTTRHVYVILTLRISDNYIIYNIKKETEEKGCELKNADVRS